VLPTLYPLDNGNSVSYVILTFYQPLRQQVAISGTITGLGAPPSCTGCAWGVHVAVTDTRRPDLVPGHGSSKTAYAAMQPSSSQVGAVGLGCMQQGAPLLHQHANRQERAGQAEW